MSSGRGKRPKNKRKTSKDKLYETFVGSYVNVVVRAIKAVDQRHRLGNLTVAGILLDEDAKYIYLGSPDAISTAIPKDLIGVVLEESVEMDVMDIPPGTVQQ